MTCTTGCMTKNHATWGECMRAKALNVKPNLMHAGRQKVMDRELQSYRDAKRQGVQPASVLQKDIDHAMKVSNETGVAFKAG